MPEILSYPVQEIKLVIRACNPSEPLPPGDKRWYDFGALRGTQVVEQLQRTLDALPPKETSTTSSSAAIAGRASPPNYSISSSGPIRTVS